MANAKSQSFELPPALKALADPTRLKIMLMLEGKPRTVGEVVDFFDLSQPTITRHLQQLAAVGLVQRSKKAQRVIYQLNPETVRCICVELAATFTCCGMTIKVAPDMNRRASEQPSKPRAPKRRVTTRRKPQPR